MDTVPVYGKLGTRRIPPPLLLAKSSHSMEATFTRKSPKYQRKSSVSSINSLLYPEIASWVAFVESSFDEAPPPNLTTLVSTGVPQCNLVQDNSALLTKLLDRTTLDTEFDRTCLDGLDDILLCTPLRAFASVCWADAVHGPSRTDQKNKRIKPSSQRISTVISPPCSPATTNFSPGKSTVISQFHSPTSTNFTQHPSKWSTFLNSPTDTNFSSEDSMSDFEECQTIKDYIPMSPSPGGEFISGDYPVGEKSVMDEVKSLFNEDYDASFMSLEPCFNASYPVHSSGLIPAPRKRKVSDTISALFPYRLVKTTQTGVF